MVAIRATREDSRVTIKERESMLEILLCGLAVGFLGFFLLAEDARGKIERATTWTSVKVAFVFLLILLAFISLFTLPIKLLGG